MCFQTKHRTRSLAKKAFIAALLATKIELHASPVISAEQLPDYLNQHAQYVRTDAIYARIFLLDILISGN